jgi:hypothetical protein
MHICEVCERSVMHISNYTIKLEPKQPFLLNGLDYPRLGSVMLCPECHGLLTAADLSAGLLMVLRQKR